MNPAGDNNEDAFGLNGGLPVAVLAMPDDVDLQWDWGNFAFEHEQPDANNLAFAEEIQDADLVEHLDIEENHEVDAVMAEVEENEVIRYGDVHPLARFANLRGRNAESLSSYLYDMVREGHTCISILGGWSRRLERSCNRVVEHCNTHKDHAFYISSNGRTALHEACLRGSCSHIIRALLEANALGAMDRDHQGNTPLHLLFVGFSAQTHSSGPHEDTDTTVTDLLAISPTFLAGALNMDGNTPLHMACSSPETMVPLNRFVQLLLANPSAASKVNNHNQTPLRLHCQRRNASVEVAKILFMGRPETIRVLDSDGWAPLHYAAVNANFELIRYLVEANPDAAGLKTSKGETALHLICRQSLGEEQLPCIDILLQAYPDAVTQRDVEHFYTPLHLLCLAGSRASPEVIIRLLQVCSQAAQIADAEHYLPIHHACENGCEPLIVLLLLQHYPSAAYSMTRKQDSALSLACTSNRSAETVQMLIEANPDALVKKNDYGFAPLHCVCRAYQPRMGIVQALLEACPSCVSLKTHGGETPIHLACNNSGAFVGVLQLLTKAQNESLRKDGDNDQQLLPETKPMTNKVGNTPRTYQEFRKGLEIDLECQRTNYYFFDVQFMMHASVVHRLSISRL